MVAPLLQFHDGYWTGRFQAMASPCEILIDTEDRALAEQLTHIAQQEALRIERKFSRYRDDNILYKLNHSKQEPLKVDPETAHLLDYAAQCYQLSDGLFDVTSGVLREVWTFDGSDNIPSVAQVQPLLSRIGWDKIRWQTPYIQIPQGMQIDFGGIGKEYAVDRSILLLKQAGSVSCLVNYGGDTATSAPRANDKGWIVGVENPDLSAAAVVPQLKRYALKRFALKRYALKQGAIATSGDSRRYLLKNGRRYGHILDPRTGWPVTDAPRSVTVIASSCTEAGILATLAMLHGMDAELFLEQQGVEHWCIRG